MSLFYRHIYLTLLTILPVAGFCQKGLQVHAGGAGGITFIAAQNDYDNSFYELDYKNTIGYTGTAGMGYGFRRSIVSIVADAGISNIRQNYTGKFSPGLGFVGKGEHEKSVSLTYYTIGVYTRLATSFADDYVIDNKVQGYVLTGFQLGFLGGADVSYLLDGNVEPYPSKLRPYTDPDYPYLPVEDSKDLFKRISLSYQLQIGIDLFLSEKFALSPGIRGGVSVLDINNKDYAIHSEYKSSRFFFGGLYIGLAYFINRG